MKAKKYYKKLTRKPSFTQHTNTGISDHLENVFEFAENYHRNELKRFFIKNK